jgi:hypothetical protein
LGVVASAVDTSVTAAAFALLAQRHVYRKWTEDGRSPDSLTKQLAEALDFWEACLVDLQANVAGLQGVDGALAEPVAVEDFDAGAEWDNDEPDVVSGTVQCFTFEITGSSVAPTSPGTITLTFPTAFATAPRMAIPVKVSHDDASTVTGWSVETLNTTTLVLKTIGNISDAIVETCRVMVVL